MSAERRLLLIDAGSIIHPAYHVMRDLATAEGFPTGAIYGFVRTLLKLLRDYPSEYVAVAFDSKGETVRHRKFEEYKANRPLMDDELAVQIPKIKELLAAWGIPSFAKEGYEADDIIATLAKAARGQGLPVLIVSGDKDLMQLVDDGIKVLKPARPPRQEVELLDRDGVKERLGVPPKLVVDYLALIGDKVDNVPGVPGVGEKTARKLLEEFGSLENILESAEKVGNARVRNSLLKHKENALLSRELVRLQEVELELEDPLGACLRGEMDRERLRQLLEELEFRSILKELGLARRAESEGEYHAILNKEEFESLLQELERAEEFSLDLETTHQDSMRAEIVGVALALRPYEGFYIPVGHSYIGAPEQLERAYVLGKLKPFLEDEGKKVIGQNLKYDAKVLRRHGISLQGISFDSLLAAYLLDPTSRKDLDELAARYLKREMISYKELSKEDMREVPVEEATRYAGEDAEIVFRLKEGMVKELKEKELWKLFTEVELPLIDVLVEMELNGILLDPHVLEEQAKEIEVLLDNLRQEIFSLAGEEFNPNSPKQVAYILYERLKLPVIKKTKTGPSTDALTLKELALQHPLPEKILTYRELEKLLNTYIKKLPEYINPETGRIHTSFNQSVTATGRLSCLPAGTLVNTQNGLVGIEEVRPGDLIRTPFGPRRVLAQQMTGEKPVVRLTLSNGITLRCSPEHRFRSRGRWLRADQLTPGTPLYMSFTPGLFGDEVSLNLKRMSAYPTKKSPRLPEAWTSELAELVGYSLADGHIAYSNYNGKPAKLILAFGWDEEELINHFAGIIQRIFGKSPTRRLTRSCPVLEVSGVDIAGSFVQLGLGKRSREARVPKGVFRAPERIVAAFLRGYFEGDGCVSEQIMARSTSRALLEDLQQLLTLFGIPSAITGGSADPRGYAPRWTLRILGDRSKQIFYEQIGFISTRKRRACRALLAKDSRKSNAELFTLPESFTIEPLKRYIYDAARLPQGKPPQAVYIFTSKMARGRRTMTLPRAEWVLQTLEDAAQEEAPFLHEAVSGGYYEVTVSEISHEPGPPVPMYDIAVEGEQYMAQGILVHNSSDPNLQNIPVRTELGGQIRKAFIAPEGRKLLAADYSQIELRLLAHFSGDEGLIEAFKRDEDLHTRTAAEIFEASKEEVTREQREIAKRVNFATIYGVSAFRLSKELSIPQKEAQRYLDKYFERYPRVKQFIEEKIREAEERGYATTILNRRRYLPHINSRNYNMRSYDQRNAINTPIQGCLPYETRVLTSEGYLQIGDLAGRDCRNLKVWTGSGFAPFMVLNRGPWELAELILENGKILKCDTRHQVLVVTEEGYNWRSYQELEIGDRICLNLPQEIEFGSPPEVNYEYIPRAHNGKGLTLRALDETFCYWLGFYYGDGWLHCNPDQQRWVLYYALGAKHGSYSLEEKVESCQRYFRQLGLNPRVHYSTPRKATVAVYSKGLAELLEELGVTAGANAATKRVPEFIFRSPLKLRRAFLRGVLDADGYTGGDGATNPSIHLCQRLLLEDLWLLFRTIGVEGKLRGPYHYKEQISYRLDLVGGMLERSLGFSGRASVKVPRMAAPKFIVEAFLKTVSSRQLSKPSHRVLYSRLRKGGNVSIYTLAEMVRAAGAHLPIPLYGWSPLKEKRSLGVEEETFTIAVDDPLHRFDSEGVISKNSAADLMKLAMLHIYNKVKAGELKADPLLQIHDELIFELDEGEVERAAPLIRETMERVMDLHVPLKVDIKVGDNWGEI